MARALPPESRKRVEPGESAGSTRWLVRGMSRKERESMAREVQRSVLPIPDQPSFGLVTYDARDPETKFPPIEPLRPPAGAPNVLVILLDDIGFGASSAFGGPCSTPTAEKLASQGLSYSRFHTTALCAPT